MAELTEFSRWSKASGFSELCCDLCPFAFYMLSPAQILLA